MAETLKFGNLTIRLRVVCLAFALMLAQIAQLSGARAHITCLKIDELRTNDPAIVALVERHYGTKDFFVGTLDRRFYVVRLGPADCGYPTCIHRVIQVIDGAVHERLAFDATGWVLWFTSHAAYAEPLKDVFDPIAFETSEHGWIVIKLSAASNVFVIGAGSAPTQFRCGRSGN